MKPFTYELAQPKVLDSEQPEVKTLEFNFDKITGETLLNIHSEMGLPPNGAQTFLHPVALNAIAAKATGQVPDDLLKLSAEDSFEVMAIVQHFLSGTLRLTKYVNLEENSQKEGSDNELVN